jgi:S-adenosylmethionine synthetase
VARYVFFSESAAEGHPDKVADAISDAVLDVVLAVDPRSRVAVETFVKANMVVIGGEITVPSLRGGRGSRPRSIGEIVNIDAVVREAIRRIGYVHDDDVFHADRVFVQSLITAQSPDIAQGVDARRVKGKRTAEQGAGDQGVIYGYATDETPEFLPAPLVFAHRLGKRLAELRHGGRVRWLRPDGKTQVSVEYAHGRPVRISGVVVSVQHAAEVDHAKVEDFVLRQVVRKVLPKRLLDARTRILVNPTGRFVVGGPQADVGLTGRKGAVDAYGGIGHCGDGSFSGKDPSKVDRSAAYLGRWIAKNVVAAGLARRAEIQFAYAIGDPDPVSVNIDTFETGTVPDETILAAILETFSFRPADIVTQLDLLRPIYSKTTNYGHFGKDDPDFTWERLDKVEVLREMIARFTK